MPTPTLWLACSGLLLIGIEGVAAAAGEGQATAPQSIRVAEGFEVELLRSARDGEDSWISLSIDDAGRIFLGLDRSGVAVIEPQEEEAADATDAHEPFPFRRLPGTDDLRHCRGMLATDDAVYVVATDSQQLVRLVAHEADAGEGSGNGRVPGADRGDATMEDTPDEVADGGRDWGRREVLATLPYASRYGHGMNQIVAGPDGMLWLVVGNDVQRPAAASPRSPYRDPREDWLLPSPHDLGQDDRVGYVVRFPPGTSSADDGTWSVIAGGFRNPFDLAFNGDGECFTWDADMEWDAGLPWYRPTRLNHVVAGGEYGWRWGSGKWPTFFADSLPTTLDTGFGSPTGMLFGDRTDWPDRYRQALFMADWQHGRMLMVDLVPQGASYQASAEVFLEGSPLNICDIDVGPDRAMYFITGGRGSQSGLYRVRWTGAGRPSEIPAVDPAVVTVATAARATRHRLEALQADPDPRELWFIVDQLGSADRWLRQAARVALERQPLSAWQHRVDTLEPPQARRTAALALARVGPPEASATVIDAVLADDWKGLPADAIAESLRILELSLIRQGLPDEQHREAMLARLETIDPQASFTVTWLAGELLVKLESPQAIPWLLAALGSAATQEEQVQHAKTLARVANGWSPKAARQVVAWLGRSHGMPGGRLVETAWQQLRSDFERLWGDEIRGELSGDLAVLDRPWSVEAAAGQLPRPFVQAWTAEEVLLAVGRDDAGLADRDPRSGLAALAAGRCLMCHRYEDRGTHTGPELTHVGRRSDTRALLESILEPARQIDPKYALSTLLLDDGRLVTGRTVGVNDRELTIEVDPLTAETVVVERRSIEQSLPAARSPMPEGLLDTLTRDEILDLLALLRGRSSHTAP